MPYFFIEMGQGIIATGDFSVTTSRLHNCILISGYNDEKKAGVFHYPSLALVNNNEEIQQDLMNWFVTLAPTHVLLTQGPSTEYQDYSKLCDWFEEESIKPTETKPAIHPVMKFINSKLEVEDYIIDPLSNKNIQIIQVQKQGAGNYAINGFSYKLVGKNRENL